MSANLTAIKGNCSAPGGGGGGGDDYKLE